MAEFIGMKQESMLPVYEEMKRRKLVTDSELREIKKNRESYEYKLNRQSKSIRDFGEYIAYERQLLRKMTDREKQNNPSEGQDRKFGPVENFIATHIKGLFKQALHLFPHEPRLWDSYIIFCKHCNYYVEISNAYEKMLQYHDNEPKIWLNAIEWEFQETGNMVKVKDLLLRSIQKHPENEALHIQFFKIMLSEAEKMSTELVLENNKTSERDIGLRRVEVIYQSSRKKITNINYLTGLLSILEEYPFTKKLQKMVIEDLIENFSRNEITWHTFALRELRGLNVADVLNYKDDDKNDTNKEQQNQKQKEQDKLSSSVPMEVETEQTENDNNDESKAPTESTEKIGTTGEESTQNDNGNNEMEEIDVKPQIHPPVEPVKRTLKRRIELCCSVYEKAVKTLKTETMWNYYINTMLDLNRDMSTQQALKRKKLSEAYRGAYEAELLSKAHFESYIELLKESTTKKEIIEEIMKKGTKLHPTSITLWELWMEYYAIQDDPKKIYQIFREATKILSHDSFPLWQMLLRYYLTRSDLSHKIDQIYKEAIYFKESNFLQLRVQYLEWTLLMKGIEATRKLYDEMTNIPPPYYELHYNMALFESNQLNPNIIRWRKCHENIIQFFGKDRTDIWINYIKFERDHGEVKNMSLLFERANSTLNVNLVTKFSSEHSYLSTGIM